MATDIRGIFVTGLRNAHAMENQALSIVEPQISCFENYSAVRDRLEINMRETQGQIERTDEILSGLSEDSSTLKDTAMSLAGSMAAVGRAMTGDEIVKNSVADFAFEIMRSPPRSL